MRSILSRLAALLAIAIAALPGTAAAQTCGDTLTSSFTLSADLHCSTGWTAFEVAAGGITIHLNGKTLSGTSDLQGFRLIDADNVRIVGPGTIRGFWVGANVFRSPKVRIENVTFEDMGGGVILTRSHDALVRGNRFFRIAGNGVWINDPTIGESWPSGNNRIAGNQFGKVDVAISTCGSTAGGNLIEGNRIAAAYSAGIHIGDHSSGNYIAGNAIDNAWSTGIRIEASRGNTLVDNRIDNSDIGLDFPARRSGQCVLDPAMGHDNGDHKVYDNLIAGAIVAVLVGNDPYDGKVFHIAFGGNLIDTASTGFLFEANSLNNHVFGSTYLGVGTPVLDLGYGNTW